MLTDAAIRRLKPREKPFKVSDMHGLYLLVHPDGGRYWRLDYVHDSKRGTLALGVYPEVSLKEAREKRSNAGKLIEKGINPSTYGKLTRGVGSISAGDTFATVADEWLRKTEAEGRATKTLEKLRWLISFANPLIGSRPIGEITAPELLTVLRTDSPADCRASVRYAESLDGLDALPNENAEECQNGGQPPYLGL